MEKISLKLFKDLYNLNTVEEIGVLVNPIKESSLFYQIADYYYEQTDSFGNKWCHYLKLKCPN